MYSTMTYIDFCDLCYKYIQQKESIKIKQQINFRLKPEQREKLWRLSAEKQTKILKIWIIKNILSIYTRLESMRPIASQRRSEAAYTKKQSDIGQQKGYNNRNTVPSDIGYYEKSSRMVQQKILSPQNVYSSSKVNNNSEINQDYLIQKLLRNPGLSYQINSIFERPSFELKFPSPYIKYKIVPLVNQKKCLDVTTINNEKKGLKKHNLTIWDYHGGPNQQFYVKESQQYPEKYYIINVSKGFTLEVPDSDSKQGTQLLINPRNNTPNELWDLKPTENAFFITAFNGMVIDVFEQQTSNGTKVIQWPSNEGKNQKWRIVPA